MRLLRKLAAQKVRETTGVTSSADATRMARRGVPGLFGLDESMFPESAPDPEEVARRARRKMLASMRRRSGRLSTILTGGGFGLA